jgi:predicted MFS family arabinose efflux permease
MKRLFWIFALSGACANFACLGIARYFLSPMIPVLVKHKWLSLNQANMLATILFVGYLLSVLFSSKVVSRFSKRNIIRGGMSILVVAFIASSFNFGVYWIAFWIFIMGVQTGVIFINAPTLMLSAVYDTHKGYLSGIMFTGMGIGTIFSSYIATYVSKVNLQLTWLTLALCLFIALLLAWKRMPWDGSHLREKIHHDRSQKKLGYGKIPIMLVLGFSLFHMGSLPVVVYLSEYIAKYFIDSSNCNRLIAISWSLVGIGFAVGPFLFGYLSKHIGNKNSLLVSLACLGTGTLLLSFGLSELKIYLFSLLASLGLISSASLYSSINSITSNRLSVYRNWQYILIGGATALLLGSILFEQIIIYFSYSYVFIIGALMNYLALIIAVKINKKKKGYNHV